MCVCLHLKQSIKLKFFLCRCCWWWRWCVYVFVCMCAWFSYAFENHSMLLHYSNVNIPNESSALSSFDVNNVYIYKAICDIHEMKRNEMKFSISVEETIGYFLDYYQRQHHFRMVSFRLVWFQFRESRMFFPQHSRTHTQTQTQTHTHVAW